MSTLTEQITGTGPTKQLEAALHDHFIAPQDRDAPTGAGAIYLTEVTAPETNRRADAVHIGLWQSRGAGRIDVCELKTSRSDFLRELDQPAKAEAWWPYSTAFWLVVPHVSIAGPEDMPPGWGLMVPSGRGRRFKVLVKPEERTPRIDVPLLLTLLKNTETTRTNALQRLRQDLASASYQREQELRKELASKADPRTAERLALLDRLEDSLGMTLAAYGWRNERVQPEAVADALRALAKGAAAVNEARSRMEHTARDLDRIAASIARKAEELRAAVAQAPAALSSTKSANDIEAPASFATPTERER